MNNDQKPLVDVFCANEQTVTPHTAEVEPMNGEHLFTCTNCGRFIKFSRDVTPNDLHILLAAHEESNKGQISLQPQIDTLMQFVQERQSGATQPVEVAPNNEPDMVDEPVSNEGLPIPEPLNPSTPTDENMVG